jgi:hypothetical protein
MAIEEIERLYSPGSEHPAVKSGMITGFAISPVLIAASAANQHYKQVHVDCGRDDSTATEVNSI